MQTPTLSVLINGAGPAGLVCALALAKFSKFHVRVLDPRARELSNKRASSGQPFPSGIGWCLGPSGIRVLHDLGVLAKVSNGSAAVEINKFSVGNGEGRRWGSVEPPKLSEDHLATADLRLAAGERRTMLGVSSAVLCAALERELLEHGISVEGRPDLQLSALEIDEKRPRGRRSVRVSFSNDGTQNIRSQSEVDVVVGADGIGSAIRRLAWVESGVSIPGGRSLQAYTKEAPRKSEWSAIPGPAIWHRFVTRPDSVPCGELSCAWGVGFGGSDLTARRLVVTPVTPNLVSMWGPVSYSPSPSIKASDAGFFAAFEKYTGDTARNLLRSVQQDQKCKNSVALLRTAQIMCHHGAKGTEDESSLFTRHGHIALIGDAAHAMPVETLMGATLAMEDGWELANCLLQSAVVRSIAGDSPFVDVALALEVFEARRKHRIQWWLDESVRLEAHGANYSVKSGLRAAVRDFMLRWRFGASGLKQQLKRNAAWESQSLIDERGKG